MAEPRPKGGPLQIHVSYSFDRLLESKLAQAYDILVPTRERPIGGRVKEFDDEDGGDLRTGFVRAATRGEHDRSEEHTSELQSLAYLVCRLLLEKKKKYDHITR